MDCSEGRTDEDFYIFSPGSGCPTFPPTPTDLKPKMTGVVEGGGEGVKAVMQKAPPTQPSLLASIYIRSQPPLEERGGGGGLLRRVGEGEEPRLAGPRPGSRESVCG